MKKLIQFVMNRIKSLVIIFSFFLVPLVSLGSDPPPPPPPPCPGSGNPADKVGGANAPIEDGIPVILALAFFYGVYKLRQTVRKSKDLEHINNKTEL